MNLIGKPKLIRTINRKLIINLIRQKQIITKTELFKLSGLSKQTINNIMISLLKKNLVIEEGYGKSTEEGGKRPLLYRFNATAYYLLGIIIVGNIIKYGITDLNGKILFRDQTNFNVKKGPDALNKELISLLDRTLYKVNIDSKKLLGIGLGIPGVINVKNGMVNILTSYPVWKYTPLKNMIEKRFKIPVVIENEANIKALGEKWFGIGMGRKNFITIDTTKKGIGAGIIINNEIYRGPNYLSGEIGQMILNINYNPDNNKIEKFDMVEDILSQQGVNQIIRENIKKGNYRSPAFINMYNKESEISLDNLFNYFNNNPEDDFVKLILDKIVYIFAIMLINLICVIDTELIIIHGKFTILNDRFFKKVLKIVGKNIFPDIKKKIEIIRSPHSNEIDIMGSAGMVLEEIGI